MQNWLYSQRYLSGVSSLGEMGRPSGACTLMAGWLEGLMVEKPGVSMAVVVSVGGASLSGSNSSRIMLVLCVSGVGWGGGGERGRCMV